jgi:transcriptional regulator with PAS, ATPase and Fis domain
VKPNTLVASQMPVAALKLEYQKKCSDLILETLSRHGGNKTRAARELGVKRPMLVSWLRENHPELVQPATRPTKIKDQDAEVADPRI